MGSGAWGGATKWEGRSQEKYYPHKKKGGRKKYKPCYRRDSKSFKVVLTWELEVLAILKGGRKTFPSIKRGVQNLLPCLEGGHKMFQTRNFFIL